MGMGLEWEWKSHWNSARMGINKVDTVVEIISTGTGQERKQFDKFVEIFFEMFVFHLLLCFS